VNAADIIAPIAFVLAYMFLGVLSVPLLDRLDDRIMGRGRYEYMPPSHLLFWPITVAFALAWLVLSIIICGLIWIFSGGRFPQ
jgi:hypothetical protein